MYYLRHPEARWERIFFERTRTSIRGFISRAAKARTLSGVVLEIGSGLETFTRDAFVRETPQLRFLRSEMQARHRIEGASEGAAELDLRCDVTRLGIRSMSVDGVICSEVLEHVFDYRSGIAEIARILKPGGVLVLTTPFLYPLHGEIDLWRFTPQALELMLRDAFDIQEIALFPWIEGAPSFPVGVGIIAARRG